MARPDAAPVRERAARWIAPCAFFAAAVVLVLLIHSSLNGGSSSAATTVISTPTVQTTTTTGAKPHKKRFYTVRAGDTLESIAGDFHTTVDRLLALNPKVDPLALTTGERVRVR